MMTAPACCARSIFSRWMRLNGVSRTHRTSLRPSLSITSAERARRSSQVPAAIFANVPTVQGITAITSTATFFLDFACTFPGEADEQSELLDNKLSIGGVESDSYILQAPNNQITL